MRRIETLLIAAILVATQAQDSAFAKGGSGRGGHDDGITHDTQPDDNQHRDSHGGSKRSDNEDRRIRARLIPTDGVATLARGKVEYRLKSNGSKRDDRLKITVKIPLPSSIPAAADQTEAQALVLRAVFYRAGVAYAACSLGYHDDEQLEHPSIAEFRSDVRGRGKKSNLKLKENHGSCLINLNSPDEQPGLPIVQSGDSLNVEDSVAGEFLGVILP